MNNDYTRIFFLALGFITSYGVPLQSADRESLIEAIQKGQQEQVKELLAKIDPSKLAARLQIVDEEGLNPLIAAVAAHKPGIVEQLLKAGANPNEEASRIYDTKTKKSSIVSAKQGTALVTAVRKGFKDIVEILLAQGADVNLPDRNGISPLMAALHKGDSQMALFLLQKGADANTSESKGFKSTALMLAVQEGLEDVVDELIKKRAAVNWEDVLGTSALLYAIKRMNVTPEAWKISSGARSRIIKTLLEHGASVSQPDGRGNTALLLAVQAGEPNIVASLLQDRGINVNEQQLAQKPYLAASFGVKIATLPRLIKTGSEKLPRFLAQATEETKRLISGNAPLHYAAALGNDEIVRMLLAKGATIDLLNQNEETPLLVAAKADQPDVAMTLLKQGARPNAKDVNGITPLMAFVRNGNSAMVEELLKRGASPHIQDVVGHTPLTIAASKGYKDIVQMLLATAPSRLQMIDAAIEARTASQFVQEEADVVKAALKKDPTRQAEYENLMKQVGTYTDIQNMLINGIEKVAGKKPQERKKEDIDKIIAGYTRSFLPVSPTLAESTSPRVLEWSGPPLATLEESYRRPRVGK